MSNETSNSALNEPILQYFAYSHLPERLQAVSKPFGDLAESMIWGLPRNAERSVALRKLLEAKDAAVRAFIFKEEATREKPHHIPNQGKSPYGYVQHTAETNEAPGSGIPETDMSEHN